MVIFGCSNENSALDRCLLTESTNLQKLTSGAYSLAVNEHVSPYYSESVHKALEAFKTVYLNERIKVLESTRQVYGSDPEYLAALKQRDSFLAETGFMEMRRHGHELMFYQISDKEYNQLSDKCKSEPACQSAKEKLEDWNIKWNDKWFELYEKVKKPEFQEEIKDLITSLQEVLESIEYKDWIALTPTDSRSTLNNILHDLNPKPDTKGSSLRRKSKDVATMFIINLEYERTEDLEPFPYDNLYGKMKQDHQNGTYNDWLDSRFAPIAYKPTVNELAAKVCQSRGVY